MLNPPEGNAVGLGCAVAFFQPVILNLPVEFAEGLGMCALGGVVTK
jgi:hypothetical protein